jgi:hypothetical protein
MNETKSSTRGEWGVNDVHQIVDEVKKLKDELRRVWIKNHNIEVTLAIVKLFVVANLMYAMLMFVTTILFLLKKWKVHERIP